MKKIKTRYFEYFIMGCIFLGAVLLFLAITGTLFSGLHLVDDHEFFSISSIINENGFWNGMIRVVIKDFSIRFRPLYSIVRVIGVCLFGTNAVAWSVCKAIEIALAMIFFYIFAREMNINKIFSILFAFLILVGEQSAIWWRLGPQESVGILLFSICMLATLYLGKKRNALSVILFILVCTLLSLQKESFCIAMPGFILLLMSYDVARYKENSISFKYFLSSFIKVHLVEIITLLLVFAIEIYAIVFIVGTHQIGYAGFSSKWPLKDYIIGVLVNLKHWCMPYLLMAIGMVFIIQIEFKKEIITYKEIFELLFCVYIFCMEQVLHAKSGMWERYLIPWVIAVCYFVVIIGYRLLCSNRRILISACGMLVIFLIYFVTKAIPEAIVFADQGEQLNQCMHFIDDNSNTDSEVVSVTKIKEEDGSFGVIMKGKYGYTNCKSISEYEDDISKLGSADVLFGKSGQVYYRLSEEAGLSLDDYEFFETEYYEVGIKKETLQ